MMIGRAGIQEPRCAESLKKIMEQCQPVQEINTPSLHTMTECT